MQFVPSTWLRSLGSPRLAVIGALVWMAAASAQEPAVFRSGIDLLTIDATVIGPDGVPDPNLGPEDFVLKVGGKPRRVFSAQFVRQTQAETSAVPTRHLHFSSNEFADPGRFVVVAVDEPHIRRVEGRSALQAASTFISGLDAQDRVAVLGLGRQGAIEFTRDRAAAQRKLSVLTGQGDPAFLRFNIGLVEAIEIADGGRARLAEVVQRECGRALTEYLSPARIADEAPGGRDGCPEQVEQDAAATAQHARTQARISVSALEGIIASLKELNRPTTLVLLSEGMVADPRLLDFSELATAAQNARVSIYVLQMEVPLFEASTDRVSPTFLKDVQMRGDGLTRLAGSARGAVFRLLGNDPAPFNRIANELTGHYLIAFEPLASERDGRVHHIELSAARRGTTVRARQSFRLPATSASPRAREEELVTLLRSALAPTELPVRVATYTYVEPVTSDVRVIVSTEADDAARASAGLVLGYVLVDGRGVILSSGAHRTTGGRHAFTTKIPRGNYTLRVAGIDALGRRGMVERSFTAAVTQYSNVQVSDLILAPLPPKPDAPLHPVVDRIAHSRVIAYLELAPAAAGRPLDVLKVHFEVFAEDETPTDVEAPADVVQSGGMWARARAVLPLDTLPSGRYVAIAQVLGADGEIARVSRAFSVP